MKKKDNKILNAPPLRFPEFNDEWEETSLGRICSLFSGGTPSSINVHYYDGVIPFIRSGEIHSNTTDLFLSEKGLKESSAKLVEKGDLLLALYGATSGDIAISQLNGAINQAILCIRSNVANKIMESIWNKHSRSILIKYLQGGQGNLSADIVKNIHFSFPKQQEQQKIAGFIQLIDNRISTQKKIIEDLRQLKDGICDKCFSHNKDNQSICRLGDVGCFIRGLSYSSEDVEEQAGGTIILRSNNIINGDVVNVTDDIVHVNVIPSSEQVLRNNDIVICMANGSSRLVGKVSFYEYEESAKITVGTFCGIYRTSNPLIKWFLQSSLYRKCIRNSIQGGNGAIANIYPQDILRISFNLPDNSNSIITTLNAIESDIQNESKLLNKLILQKQYLLSMMFI